MPVSYDVLTFQATQAPSDTRHGEDFPVSCRTLTVGVIPSDINLRISFDRQNKFVPCRGGEVFRSHGRDPFQSVQALWETLTTDSGLPEYGYLFAGGDTISMDVGAGAETIPDDVPRDDTITLETLAGSAIRVDVDGCETVIITPRASNAGSLYAAHTTPEATAAGDSEEIVKTSAPREFRLTNNGKLYIGGTEGDKFSVRIPGV